MRWIFWRTIGTLAPMTSIVLFFYYGSQWCQTTVWFQSFFIISSFVFSRRKTLRQVSEPAFFIPISESWQPLTNLRKLARPPNVAKPRPLATRALIYIGSSPCLRCGCNVRVCLYVPLFQSNYNNNLTFKVSCKCFSLPEISLPFQLLWNRTNISW